MSDNAADKSKNITADGGGDKEPDTTAFEKTKPTINRKTDLARNDGKVLTENGSLSLIPVFI